jgi:hypothetical protein
MNTHSAARGSKLKMQTFSSHSDDTTTTRGSSPPKPKGTAVGLNGDQLKIPEVLQVDTEAKFCARE